VGSMGRIDTPMPVLSKKSCARCMTIFRQQFAQVHESAGSIPYAESIVMSLADADRPRSAISLCRRSNMPSRSCSHRRLLSQAQTAADRGASRFRSAATSSIDLQYTEHWDLKAALLKVCDQAEARGCAAASSCCCCPIDTSSRARYPFMPCSPPAPCITDWSRRDCAASPISWWRPARRVDAHHFACLIGYGRKPLCIPYLAYQTIVRHDAQGCD